MFTDLEYDGQTLVWKGFGKWKATSGLAGHQIPEEQCSTNAGPVPEGIYTLLLTAAAEKQWMMEQTVVI